MCVVRWHDQCARQLVVFRSRRGCAGMLPGPLARNRFPDGISGKWREWRTRGLFVEHLLDRRAHERGDHGRRWLQGGGGGAAMGKDSDSRMSGASSAGATGSSGGGGGASRGDKNDLGR